LLLADSDHLFPAVNLDVWYEAFVNIPKAPAADIRSRAVTQGRPLEIAVYERQSEADNITLIQQLKDVENIVHHPTLPSYSIDPSTLPSMWSEEVRAEFSAYTLGSAAHLLAEGPLISTNIDAASGLWEWETLNEGIADAVTAYDLGTAPNLAR